MPVDQLNLLCFCQKYSTENELICLFHGQPVLLLLSLRCRTLGKITSYQALQPWVSFHRGYLLIHAWNFEGPRAPRAVLSPVRLGYWTGTCDRSSADTIWVAGIMRSLVVLWVMGGRTSTSIDCFSNYVSGRKKPGWEVSIYTENFGLLCHLPEQVAFAAGVDILPAL